MKVKAHRAALTLRFHDAQVHRLLRLVAAQEGMSMNELAEEFISEGVRKRSTDIEARLAETLNALRAHRERADRSEVERQAIREFAQAEAQVVDPLEVRILSPEEGKRLQRRGRRREKGEAVAGME